MSIFDIMLWLFFLFVVVRAEWPPNFCDSNTKRADAFVELTHDSAERQESFCSCSEPWDTAHALYIHIGRKTKTHTFSNKSLLGFKWTDSSGEQFQIVVHDRRLKITGANEVMDCPDIFVHKSIWIRIRLDFLANTNQTTVSVSYALERHFLSCVRFHLNGESKSLATDIVARTDVGTVQKVYTIQQEPPTLTKSLKSTAPMSTELKTRLETLERLLMSVQHRTGVIEQQVSGLSSMVNDMDEYKLIEERFQSSMSDTGWRMNIGFCILSVCICMTAACLTRRMHQRERIHIL